MYLNFIYFFKAKLQYNFHSSFNFCYNFDFFMLNVESTVETKTGTKNSIHFLKRESIMLTLKRN